MMFQIESSTSGAAYTVQLHQQALGGVALSCTCPAGEKGMLCKHRLCLIDGDFSDVVEATHAPDAFMDAITGTAIFEAVNQMRIQEKRVKSEQAALAKVKKQIGRLMTNGG